VAAALREGPDAIAVGAITTPEHAAAVIDAVAAGQLVLATLAATADRAADHLVELLPLDRRDLAKAVIARDFLGAVAGVVQGANRRFEVVARRD
jgi:Tfp pilus assembly pilus retraction ATPase PilT